MFGIVKSAHAQMRSLLPLPIASDFDAILLNVQGMIPSYYDSGSRDRVLAIVMGNWIEDRVQAGDFSVSGIICRKVSYLVGIAERYNERDMRGDSHMATAVAHDISRALRDWYNSSSKESDEVSLASLNDIESAAPPVTADELERRKRALDARLGLALKS